MRLYETTFVLNPQADEAALDNQVKAIGTIITSNGGKIVAEDRMGTRRLAYEINGMMQGYYSSFLFEAEPLVLPMLERHYKLEEPYVRHLTILFEGDPEIVRERQQAMATAMEASERARRHSRSESRGGGYQRRDEGPRRSSYRDRDSSRHQSAPSTEKTEATSDASPNKAPSVDASPSKAPSVDASTKEAPAIVDSPKEAPATSDAPSIAQAPASTEAPSKTKPAPVVKPPESSSESDEL